MSFSDDIIRKVWIKGQIVTGYDSDNFRKDECGAWITFSQYGNRNSKYGWEIDHTDPNVSDNLSNLRPLQWENNLNKGDGKLKCKVTSKGNINIYVD